MRRDDDAGSEIVVGVEVDRIERTDLRAELDSTRFLFEMTNSSIYRAAKRDAVAVTLRDGERRLSDGIEARARHLVELVQIGFNRGKAHGRKRASRFDPTPSDDDIPLLT